MQVSIRLFIVPGLAEVPMTSEWDGALNEILPVVTPIFGDRASVPSEGRHATCAEHKARNGKMGEPARPQTSI